MSFLSVVIPAYNEEANLARLVDELERNLKQCSDIRTHEVIIVDDHSSDRTFESIQNLAKASKGKIRGMRLSRRSGSHTALRAGIAGTKGDLVLCIAADGQDDPAALGRMIQKIKEGCDMVWAIREKRDEPFLSQVLTGLAYRLIRAFINQESSELNVANADFFMFNRAFADAINRCPERNTSLFGLMLWLGFKQGNVPYERRERFGGKSKWNLGSKMLLLKDWVIAFSGIPLKLIFWMGLFTATAGLLYATFIVVYSLLGLATPGWAETVILILVMGGVQMLMLGVMGEYLWRNLDETRSRPLYFIESAAGEDT